MTTVAELVRVLDEDNFVILDTETTGLHHAEVCSIAMCDNTGNVFIDTLVKTQRLIPADATKIHGITNDMVKMSPTWLTLNPHIQGWLKGRDVIIYNANYDVGVIETTNERWGILAKDRLVWTGRTHCAMEAYAEFNGEWSDYHQNYSYVKLKTAYDRMVKNQKIPLAPHSARGDVLMTYGVCKSLQSAFKRH